MKMIQNIKQTILLALLFFIPLYTYGAPPPTTKVTLENYLKIDTIEDFLDAILRIVLVFAVPIIVFFIIYSGFLYVTAQGNAEQIKQATRSLTYAVIGGVLILGAYAIATIVKNLVAAF